MLEHLAVDSQPTIRVSDKTVVVFDWSDHLEVKVGKIVALCSRDCLHLPLVGPFLGNTDKRAHAIPAPVDEEEGVARGRETGNEGDGRKVVDVGGIIAESVFSRTDVEASHLSGSVSGEVFILPICASCSYLLVP
jgi:hypothetical protein